MKKKIPLPIWVVSILFIMTGCVSFGYHLKELKGSTDIIITLLILFVGILAIIAGVLLLYKISWARWLAIAWLFFHVVLSAFNSIPEMIVHICFLVAVAVMLFLPVSSKYFGVIANDFWKSK